MSASDPRPSKLSPLNIQAEAAAVRETDDVYRLYRPEWVIAYGTTRGPADADEKDMLVRTMQYFRDHYEGRVRPEDVRFSVTNQSTTYAIARLDIRMPVLKGEFKFAFLAERHANEQGWSDWQIVARNSKADHELRSYGVKLLPA